MLKSWSSTQEERCFLQKQQSVQNCISYLAALMLGYEQWRDEEVRSGQRCHPDGRCSLCQAPGFHSFGEGTEELRACLSFRKGTRDGLGQETDRCLDAEVMLRAGGV